MTIFFTLSLDYKKIEYNIKLYSDILSSNHKPLAVVVFDAGVL